MRRAGSGDQARGSGPADHSGSSTGCAGQQIVAMCASQNSTASSAGWQRGQDGPSTSSGQALATDGGDGGATFNSDSADPGSSSDGWGEDELFALVRRAYPYRGLKRETFDSIPEMLSEGIAARRGRYGADVHRDRGNGKLRA